MTLTESSRKGSALAQFQQIYRWQLKRSRLISILCLGLTFLCFSVVHLCKSVRSYHDYFDNPSELGENVSHAYLLKQFAGTIQANLMTGMATILIPLLLVFLVVSAIQTFQYMHKRRSVDLFHALPIRRTPLLLGNMAAIGTVLAVITILNLAICGVADMAMGARGTITPVGSWDSWAICSSSWQPPSAAPSFCWCPAAPSAARSSPGSCSP